MKMYAAAVLCSMMLGLLCGCSILTKEPYREIRRYDLAMPEARMPLAAKLPDVIFNLTPAGQKMLFRTDGLQLVEDPYCLWAQQPEKMLLRYFYNRFQEDTRQKPVRLTVLTWELNTVSGNAGVSVAAEFRGIRKILRSSAPMTDASGAAAAEAMSQCCIQCADQLAAWLKEMQ